MRGLVVAVAVLVASLGVGACGDNGPKVLSGRVVGLEYDDADDWETTYCVSYMKVGEVSICSVYNTDEHHDDPHWRLQLECRESAKEVHRSWVEVPEHTYSETQHGDMYPPGTETCTTDEKSGDME